MGDLVTYDPSWLKGLDVPSPGPGPSSPDQDLGWNTVPNGERNNKMATIAGALHRQGMSQKRVGQMVMAANKAMCVPPLPTDEIVTIVRSITRYEQQPDESYVTDDTDIFVVPGGGPLLLDASTFTKPPPTTWLIEPFVPDCTLTLVSGREGIGKGMFCAYLAASVAMGVRPLTGESIEPRTVLWLTAEDDPELDVWKRLRAAGWDPEHHEKIKFLNQRVRMLLPEDEEKFEELILREDPGLVIMDPGRAYFGRKDGAQTSFNNEADVAPALRGLLQISQRNRLPMVFVAHWRKGSGDTRDMTSGTGAWKQVVRHALDFAESEDETEKAFWVGKTNISQKGHVSGYHMVPEPEWDTARFSFDGDLPFHTLDKWLEATKGGGEKFEVDKMDALTTWIEHHVPIGGVVPSRTELHRLTNISDGKLRALLDELKATGHIAFTKGKPTLRLK